MWSQALPGPTDRICILTGPLARPIPARGKTRGALLLETPAPCPCVFVMGPPVLTLDNLRFKNSRGHLILQLILFLSLLRKAEAMACLASCTRRATPRRPPKHTFKRRVEEFPE